MAAIKQLAVVARSGTGKGAARSVRREGRVPGVIYGGGEKPEPVSVDFRELNKLVYAGQFLTTIFELEIGGRKERVLPRDFQLDVVTDKPVHVDFLRLRAGFARPYRRCRSMWSIAKPRPASRRAARSIWCCIRSNCSRRRTPFPRRSPSISPASISTIRCMYRRSRCPRAAVPRIRSTDFTVVTIVPPTVYQEEAPAAVATSTAAPAVAAGAPAKGAATAAPAKGAAAGPAKAAPAAAPAKGAAAPAKPAAKK